MPIVEDVSRWASRLVFSPTVWAGVAVAGVSVLLWWVSGRMLARGTGVRAGRDDRAVGAAGPRSRGTTPAGRAEDTAPAGRSGRAGRGRRGGGKDDGLGDVEGMDDIEAILRKHGI